LSYGRSCAANRSGFGGECLPAMPERAAAGNDTPSARGRQIKMRGSGEQPAPDRPPPQDERIGRSRETGGQTRLSHPPGSCGCEWPDRTGRRASSECTQRTAAGQERRRRREPPFGRAGRVRRAAPRQRQADGDKIKPGGRGKAEQVVSKSREPQRKKQICRHNRDAQLSHEVPLRHRVQYTRCNVGNQRNRPGSEARSSHVSRTCQPQKAGLQAMSRRRRTSRP